MAFDTNIYFGAPGALITLPHPRGGVKTTRVRPRQEFALGNGEMRARSGSQGSRQYELSWQGVLYDLHSTLLAYDQGHMGPGPFVLLDPGQRNLLTVNQSGSTSLLNATDNFTVGGSGSVLSSSATQVITTPRSLAWTINATNPASGSELLTLDSPYAGWPGVPVVASRPMIFSAQVRGGGTDGIVTIRPEIRWFDVTGATLSTITGANVTTTTGGWSALSVTGTPPVGTAFMQCRIQYISGASFGSIMYFTQFQLEEGGTVGTWRPGTGVFPVTIMSYIDEWPQFYSTEVRLGSTLTLRQDGR